jgi:hypothetical protein
MSNMADFDAHAAKKLILELAEAIAGLKDVALATAHRIDALNREVAFLKASQGGSERAPASIARRTNLSR